MLDYVEHYINYEHYIFDPQRETHTYGFELKKLGYYWIQSFYMYIQKFSATDNLTISHGAAL